MPLLVAATQVLVRLLLSIHLSQSPAQNTGPAPEVTRAHLEQDALCCFTRNAVTPVYPREARVRNIEGVVKLILVIASDGSIADLQGVSGDPLLLDAAMKAVRQWRFFIGGFIGKPAEIEVPLSFTFKIEDPPKPAYLHLTSGKTIRADEVREFIDGIEYAVGSRTHHISTSSVAKIDRCARIAVILQKEGDCIPAGGPSFIVRTIPLLPRMPPRGSHTARMQLCGLSKTRPISCSDCPAFQRLQTSRFSTAESPNRIPGLIPTPPLQSRFTSDGVASTYRMHPTYQALT